MGVYISDTVLKRARVALTRITASDDREAGQMDAIDATWQDFDALIRLRDAILVGAPPAGAKRDIVDSQGRTTGAVERPAFRFCEG